MSEPVPFFCVQKYDLFLNLAIISARICRNHSNLFFISRKFSQPSHLPCLKEGFEPLTKPPANLWRKDVIDYGQRPPSIKDLVWLSSLCPFGVRHNILLKPGHGLDYLKGALATIFKATTKSVPIRGYRRHIV